MIEEIKSPPVPDAAPEKTPAPSADQIREYETRATATMTDPEKQLSTTRENQKKFFESKNLHGYLDYEAAHQGPDGQTTKDRITGELNGHKIMLEAVGTGFMGTLECTGTVDGKPISNKDAGKLWDRYQDFAIDKEEINQAQNEIIQEGKTQGAADIVKELLQ